MLAKKELTLEEYKEKLQQANIDLVDLQEKYTKTKAKGAFTNKLVIGVILGAGFLHLLGFLLINPYINIIALCTLLGMTPLGLYNLNLDDKEKEYKKSIEETKKSIDLYADKIESIYSRDRNTFKSNDNLNNNFQSLPNYINKIHNRSSIR